MKKCTNCGNEIPDDAQFCVKCGNAQGETSADDTQTVTAPSSQSAPSEAATAASYKDAKAAYKQARKEAGKSRKPVIILVIVGIIVIAAAAVAAMLFVTGQGQSESQEQVEEVNVAEPAIDGASSAASDAASSLFAGVYSGPYEQYVGTWKGRMVSTSESGIFTKRCYGAEDGDMVLEILSISESGHMKANVELLYHGHVSTEGSDADSTPGDKRVSLTDLTTTFSESGFELQSSAGDVRGDRVEITVDIDGDVFVATVDNYYRDKLVETDTYELVKAA